MSDIRKELKYSESHEWIDEPTAEVVTVGISDYAQEQLGDLVFVETPEAGQVFTSGDAVAVVESVKAASDVYTPLSGEIVEVNEALVDTPELINQSPYDDGWLFRIKLSDQAEIENLMDADKYQLMLENLDS